MDWAPYAYDTLVQEPGAAKPAPGLPQYIWSTWIDVDDAHLLQQSARVYVFAHKKGVEFTPGDDTTRYSSNKSFSGEFFLFGGRGAAEAGSAKTTFPTNKIDLTATMAAQKLSHSEVLRPQRSHLRALSYFG